MNNTNIQNEGYFLSGDGRNPGVGCILDAGTKLAHNRFVIEGHLECGSTADLYKAQDLHRQEQVLLKVFTDSGPMAHNNWKPARHEANICSSVSSTEHIISTYDFHICEFGGTELFIIPMELADGGTLRSWIHKNKDQEEIRYQYTYDYISQICHGLKALHTSGYYHLDLKPENIVFCNDKLKIIDLGTSAYMKCVFETDEIHNQEFVFPPSTPAYMAPEFFSASYSRDVTAAMDIYSIGVIFYEMLHPECNLPFRGDFKRLCSLHNYSQIKPIPECDSDVMDFIFKCLEKEPDQRFTNVDEMLIEIENMSSRMQLAACLNETNIPSFEKATDRILKFQELVEDDICQLRLCNWQKAMDLFSSAETINIKGDHAGKIADIIEVIIEYNYQRGSVVEQLIKSKEIRKTIKILADTERVITEICHAIQGENNELHN